MANRNVTSIVNQEVDFALQTLKKKCDLLKTQPHFFSMTSPSTGDRI